MSRIPRDLESTMWDIADRGDRQAASEFSERFPNLRQEMDRRLEAVQGLRGYGSSLAPAFIPAFKPRFRYTPPSLIRRYAPAALGLAALAAASFYISSNLATPLPDIKEPARLQSPPPRLPEANSTRETRNPPQTDVDEGPSPFKQSPAPRTEELAPLPSATASFHGVPLLTALHTIAERASLTLIVPDNFPNPRITEDLSGKDALDLMKQLGMRHGFSAFEQGRGNVLLIPAVDSGPLPEG